jgi:septal ring factor EnvC (AmiA/AmiB activator)
MPVKNRDDVGRMKGLDRHRKGDEFRGMAEEPENHTLALLREMRAENAAFRKEVNQRFEKLEADIAEIKAQTKHIPQMRADIAELQMSVAAMQVSVAAIRTEQGPTSSLVEKIHATQQNHGARLNAIDGRLAIIEGSVGLVKA